MRPIRLNYVLTIYHVLSYRSGQQVMFDRQSFAVLHLRETRFIVGGSISFVDDFLTVDGVSFVNHPTDVGLLDICRDVERWPSRRKLEGFFQITSRVESSRKINLLFDFFERFFSFSFNV